jgi:hypothetical protein
MINPIADFLAMRRDIVAHSKLMSAWGFLLNVPVLIGGLVFFAQPVGAATVAAILVSLVIASQMHKRWPLSRMLGLCHVVFLPVIPLQLVELGNISSIGPFEIWLVFSSVMMSVCLLIDIFDLFRYFGLGNRTYFQRGSD